MSENCLDCSSPTHAGFCKEHWEKYDGVWNGYLREAEAKIQRLEKALLEADEGLEFYGDRSSWTGDIWVGQADDETFFLPNCTSQNKCGKTARETRESISQLVNEIKERGQ